MKSFFTTIAASSAVALASAGPLFAQARQCSIWQIWNCLVPTEPTPAPTPASVPEIDATTGLLAVAAVLAVMVFAWERRRRQAA